MWRPLKDRGCSPSVTPQLVVMLKTQAAAHTVSAGKSPAAHGIPVQNLAFCAKPEKTDGNGMFSRQDHLQSEGHCASLRANSPACCYVTFSSGSRKG